MALFMDIHQKVEGATARDVAGAHMRDFEEQQKYGVNYWFDESSGRIFCLVEAPDRGLPSGSTAKPTAWSPTRSCRSSRAERRPPGRAGVPRPYRPPGLAPVALFDACATIRRPVQRRAPVHEPHAPSGAPRWGRSARGRPDGGLTPQQGCGDVNDKKVLADIRNNPELYYLQAANAEFPNGALRGQLA